MRYAFTLFAVVLILPVASAQRPQPGTELFKKFAFRTDNQNRGDTVIRIDSKSDVAITDDDLKELAQFPEVKAIYLNGRKITGTGLKHFAGLKKLDTLEVAFCTMSSDGFQEISKLKGLRRLNILNTEYTADNLKSLTALTDLEMLWMGQNFKCEKDGDYKVVGEFKKLRGLAVSNSYFGDEGLKAVAALPELRTLVFSGSNVTDAGMEALAKAPKLERFRGSYNLTEKGLSVLGKIDSLREIDLYGSKVSVEAILAMPNVKKLTMIQTDFRGDVAKANQEKLKVALPNCKFTYFQWFFDEK